MRCFRELIEQVKYKFRGKGSHKQVARVTGEVACVE